MEKPEFGVQIICNRFLDIATKECHRIMKQREDVCKVFLSCFLLLLYVFALFFALFSYFFSLRPFFFFFFFLFLSCFWLISTEKFLSESFRICTRKHEWDFEWYWCLFRSNSLKSRFCFLTISKDLHTNIVL